MTTMARPAGRLLRRKAANGVMWGTAALATAIAVLALLFILVYVAAQGISSLNLAFFTQLPKPVGESGGGVGNAIVGSLLLVAVAGLIGLPIGLLGGVYLAEFGHHRLGTAVRFLADVLSGVPSIVVGIFIYTLVAQPMRGPSALAGGLALAVIVIPIVMRSTEELVRLVPRSLREGSLSLGAAHWQTVLNVVLPAARAGILTGVLLAVARVMGEAAPVLFTAGQTQWWNLNPVQGDMASLPVQIYIFATSPFAEWHRLAWGASFVLVSLVLVLNLAARWAARGRMRTVR